MKVLANKVWQRILAMLLVIVSVFSLTNLPSFARRTVTAATGDTYTLVTDASTLAAGDEVVIVCPSKSMAMGAQSGNYRTGVGVEITNDQISLPEKAVTVTLGGSLEAWTLAVSDTANSYLYWTSGNYVKTGTDSSSSGYTWKIEIATEGTATITSLKDSNRKLQWNDTSPRFACYTSAQTAIALYKLQAVAHEHAYAWDGNVGVDGSHTLVCANADGKCDALTTTAECTWVDGYCEVCNAKAPECAHSTTTEVAAIPATCTEVGYTAGVQCTVCNQYTSGHEEIAALGHNIVTDAAVDATCTTTGLTVGKHCDRVGCGYIEVEQTEVAALGHNYVDGLCTVCGEKQPTTLTITTTDISSANSYAWYSWTATTTTGVDIKGHGYVYKSSTGIQMNGAQAGDYIYNTTALPGKIVSVTLVGASGKTARDFGVLTSDTAFDRETTASLKGQAADAKKTVTTDGVTWTFETNHKYFAIVICDTKAAYLSSIEITYEVCAHTNKVAIGEAKDATCTEDGITAGVKCADCGEIITAQETIPATGHKDENPVDSKCDICGDNLCTSHDWVDGEVIEEGDCTTDRVIAQVCQNCGEPGEDKVITALGHTEEIDEAVAPTCTETGLTQGSHCSECGDIITAQEAVEATGHTWVGDVCSECGERKIIFTKVTSDLTDWSGKYLIVYEEGNVAFDGSLTTLDKTENTQSVTIEGNQIIADESLKKAYFTVTKIDGGYSIQSYSGYYIGRTEAGNGLDANKTEAYVNKITFDGTNAQIAGAGGPVLQYYLSGVNSRFRYYKSSQKAIALYKMDYVSETQTLSTEADFSIVYADEKTEDGNYVINKASICFGLTISDALYQECVALDNVVLGVEVCKKDEISDPLKWKDYNSATNWNAATLEDGSHTFGVIIGLGSGANWDKEIVAKAYIKIGDTKYYLSEVSYSINSLATEYLTKDEYKNDEIYSSVLTILQGDNGKTGGVQA